jgi:hypothetical protein
MELLLTVISIGLITIIINDYHYYLNKYLLHNYRMSHVAWTKIVSFYNVRELIEKYPETLNENSVTTYKSKVKLHGTNAGIRVDPNKQVTAMSRTGVVTPKKDNAGFAKWVEKYTSQLSNFALEKDTLLIYGEWCGGSIQKGVALNDLKNKIFVIFAVRVIDPKGESVEFITEPNDLMKYTKDITDSYVMPWYNNEDKYIVDWSLPTNELQEVVDKINDHVIQVEKCDPWVKSEFEVEGVGEGLVFYPISENHTTYEVFSELCFKAKGEKHQIVTKTMPAQLDPTVVADVEAFANLVLSEARLKQGVEAVSDGELTFNMKNLGSFLKWISEDLIKETKSELSASGLNEKIAYKLCQNKARQWYIKEVKRL